MGVESQILQFPLIRLVLVFLFIAPYLLLHNKLIGDALALSSGNARSLFLAVDAILSIGIIMFLYGLYTRFIEKNRLLRRSGKKLFGDDLSRSLPEEQNSCCKNITKNASRQTP